MKSIATAANRTTVYSKEEILGLFRPTRIPDDFPNLQHVAVQDPLSPVALDAESLKDFEDALKGVGRWADSSNAAPGGPVRGKNFAGRGKNPRGRGGTSSAARGQRSTGDSSDNKRSDSASPSNGDSSSSSPDLGEQNEQQERRWVYKDMKGELQGPFSGAQMHEWFVAGFFPQGLEVKPENENVYAALADLVKRVGGSPFIVSTPVESHGQTRKKKSSKSEASESLAVASSGSSASSGGSEKVSSNLSGAGIANDSKANSGGQSAQKQPRPQRTEEELIKKLEKKVEKLEMFWDLPASGDSLNEPLEAQPTLDPASESPERYPLSMGIQQPAAGAVPVTISPFPIAPQPIQQPQPQPQQQPPHQQKPQQRPVHAPMHPHAQQQQTMAGPGQQLPQQYPLRADPMAMAMFGFPPAQFMGQPIMHPGPYPPHPHHPPHPQQFGIYPPPPLAAAGGGAAMFWSVEQLEQRLAVAQQQPQPMMMHQPPFHLQQPFQPQPMPMHSMHAIQPGLLGQAPMPILMQLAPTHQPQPKPVAVAPVEHPQPAAAVATNNKANRANKKARNEQQQPAAEAKPAPAVAAAQPVEPNKPVDQKLQLVVAADSSDGQSSVEVLEADKAAEEPPHFDPNVWGSVFLSPSQNLFDWSEPNTSDSDIDVWTGRAKTQPAAAPANSIAAESANFESIKQPPKKALSPEFANVPASNNANRQSAATHQQAAQKTRQSAAGRQQAAANQSRQPAAAQAAVQQRPKSLREIQEEEMLQKRVHDVMKSAPPAVESKVPQPAAQPQFAQYPGWDAFHAPVKSFKQIQQEQEEVSRQEEARQLQARTEASEVQAAVAAAAAVNARNEASVEWNKATQARAVSLREIQALELQEREKVRHQKPQQAQASSNSAAALLKAADQPNRSAAAAASSWSTAGSSMPVSMRAILAEQSDEAKKPAAVPSAAATAPTAASPAAKPKPVAAAAQAPAVTEDALFWDMPASGTTATKPPAAAKQSHAPAPAAAKSVTTPIEDTDFPALGAAKKPTASAPAKQATAKQPQTPVESEAAKPKKKAKAANTTATKATDANSADFPALAGAETKTKTQAAPTAAAKKKKNEAAEIDEATAAAIARAVAEEESEQSSKTASANKKRKQKVNPNLLFTFGSNLDGRDIATAPPN